MGRQTSCKEKCVRMGPCGQLDVPTRVKIFQKKRKTFQKKKNVTSGTKIYPILKEIVWKFCYIAGTVLGRIINIFAGHSVLVYLTLNIYEP